MSFDGWSEKKVGEVCTLQRGFDLPKRLREAGKFPLVSSSGIIDTHSEAKVVAPGVVTGRSGSIGNVFYIEDDFWPLNTCLYIKDFHGNDPEFIYYFLKQFNLGRFSSGAGVPTLNRNTVHDEVVSIPDSLAEQKRIVSILDEAFSAIAKAKENAEKNLLGARELFESYLNRVFTQQGPGWQEKPLGELVDIKHGFAFKSKFFVDQSNYIVLTPGSFYEEGGFRDRGEKTKYYEGEIPDGFIHEKGDFVVAMTEQAAGLLGSSLIVPESNKYLHNQRLGLVQPKPNVSWCNEFFHHVFNTRHFRGEVHQSASGVKVRHTSPKKMYVVNVAYPPTVTEQREVAKRLDEALAHRRQLETIYTQKLANLDELKQSLLQKAFTGQLSGEMVAV